MVVGKIKRKSTAQVEYISYFCVYSKKFQVVKKKIENEQEPSTIYDVYKIWRLIKKESFDTEENIKIHELNNNVVVKQSKRVKICPICKKKHPDVEQTKKQWYSLKNSCNIDYLYLKYTCFATKVFQLWHNDQ